MSLFAERPVEEEIINRELAGNALKALDQLPKIKDAVAVKLVVVDNMKLHEAGAVMDCTKENVRQHKERGLSIIRRTLEKWGF